MFVTMQSLDFLVVNRIYYKEIKLAFGQAVTESYTSGNDTVFIREDLAPRAVSFKERFGFLCIHITFSVDLKQLSHKRVVISRRSSCLRVSFV